MKAYLIAVRDWFCPRALRTLSAARYAFYTMVHPFNGFWELKNEKRGTIGGANLLVFITLLAILWRQQYTSFQFSTINWESVNIWLVSAQFLAPLAIWCTSNWCLTTLFDGKGTIAEIYIMTAYAIAPYALIQIPLIFLSNVITADEGALYWFFDSLSYVWSGGLLLCGLMMTHDYTMLKSVVFTVATILGMIVIIALCLLIFSMSAEAIAYVVSLVREIMIRFY